MNGPRGCSPHRRGVCSVLFAVGQPDLYRRATRAVSTPFWNFFYGFLHLYDNFDPQQCFISPIAGPLKVERIHGALFTVSFNAAVNPNRIMKIYIVSLIAGICLLQWTALAQPANFGPMSDYGDEPLASATGAVAFLRVTANVDGSGRFVFTPRHAEYHHLNWSPPTQVTFNGEAWSQLDHNPTGWRHFVRGLDLTHAWIVERKGRDVIALEQTPKGFDLYMDDSPNGSADYSVTIAIPRRPGGDGSAPGE